MTRTALSTEPPDRLLAALRAAIARLIARKLGL